MVVAIGEGPPRVLVIKWPTGLHKCGRSVLPAQSKEQRGEGGRWRSWRRCAHRLGMKRSSGKLADLAFKHAVSRKSSGDHA